MRLPREKFCSLLARFWTRFAQEWDVLLHGNPAVDVFGGLKLAAGGELGIGVGEEGWGSGEREVLEDLVGRTDGLVDIVVSRYGEPLTSLDANSRTSIKCDIQESAWIGSGHDPEAPDGMIFGGVGNLTRTSLRDISQWMTTIYRDGEYAYGVGQNPHSDRKRRRRRNHSTAAYGSVGTRRERDLQASTRVNDPAEAADTSKRLTNTQQPAAPGIPPPIVSAAESALNNAISSADAHRKVEAEKEEAGTVRKRPGLLSSGSWMRVLTLGYMSSPTSVNTHGSDERLEAANAHNAQEQAQAPLAHLEPAPDGAREEHERLVQEQQESSGYYLIGLKGVLTMSERDSGEAEEADESGSRLLLRMLYVKLNRRTPYSAEIDKTLSRNVSYDRSTEASTSTSGGIDDDTKRLRVVIYVHRPFIYAFLFEPRTDSLSIPSFYRSLATHLQPLHKPLCRNTSPSKVKAEIESAQHSLTKTTSPSTSTNDQRIFDLIYDPNSLTVHTSLPNIPSPASSAAEDGTNLETRDTWSRVEALNVHTQLLNIVSSTQRRPHEIERTCKTSRGWWVVWMRVSPAVSTTPQLQTTASDEQQRITTAAAVQAYRQAFLIRKASDGQSAGSTRTSGANTIAGGMLSLRGPSWGGGAAASTGAGWGPGRLAEGIGVDARRYVEGLLSLNR